MAMDPMACYGVFASNDKAVVRRLILLLSWSNYSTMPAINSLRLTPSKAMLWYINVTDTTSH
ncbi:MAG: hypothetical protein DWP95_13225 [Proteobacteria bacterium]|nr:MAG: hypothetical protein DWP95_13225 [Pseudomonadota bacterium]